MLNTLVGIAFIIIWIVFLVYIFYTVLAGFRGAVYLPTFSATLKGMLQLAELRPGETLVDLGSGDGRIVIQAALQGARATGYEINPLLVLISRIKARLKGASNASFRATNFWDADLRDVDVVAVYLVPAFMPKLKEKVLREMKPGSRIVAGVYPLPDWEPDATLGSAYCYRLPKKS